MTEKELYTYVIDKAVQFGMKPKNLPAGTTHSEEARKKIISPDGGNAIVRHSLAKGAYIGLIDGGQPIVEDNYESEGTNDTTGNYTGLSFVVFTQCQALSPSDKSKESSKIQDYCIVSIGIGSSSLGEDLDLASKPGFRRSFMNLTAKGHYEMSDYYFVENWSAMNSACPGLEADVNRVEANNGPLHQSLKMYSKLLPAACLIKLPIDSHYGIPALDAWLAKYAQWRGWMPVTKVDDEVAELFSKKRTPAKSQKEIEDEIKLLIEMQRFIVLQGAPGCGKTWTANKIASSVVSRKRAYDKVFFTQFHAETTYADFVCGIKPVLNGKDLAYEGKAGTLLEAIDYAARHQEEKVLLIIDEINRANLANVLGPVFYLFEPNAIEREHELFIGSIKSYKDCEAKKDSEIFYRIENGDIYCKYLPENLYVIATMNTADKSLAVVDFALRRRFSWYTLFPHVLKDKDLAGKHFNLRLFSEIEGLFESFASDSELNLQPGHSYFITVDPEPKDGLNDEMKRRLKYELMPLMKEYFAEGYLLEAKEEFAQLYYKYTKEYMYK